eukprot:GFUD01017315.1.p1 GENE.GFUD01017315.1~~GFUD01017315.1.p1  ORF type:complete len:440 (-),score=99.86 GFUD01017315.1:28-1347(-)
MAGLKSVDWSKLLSADFGIPCDVTLKIATNDVFNKEPGEDDVKTSEHQAPHSFTAHKFALSAVSPVFRTQFYGSIPAGDVVVVKDSNVEAFKIMLDYVYQNPGVEGVEELDDVCDLFDVFYLADKYEVLGLREKILRKFCDMSVNVDNYEAILSALQEFAHFEVACDVLKSRVLNLIEQHSNPLELVEVAIESKDDSIKEKVLYSLGKVGKSVILESVKAAYDIIESDGCNLEEEALTTVMEACVQGYEEVLESPSKLCKFMPEPTSHLHKAYSRLQQYWKNKFCFNCGSSACLNGKKVHDMQKLKVGARVQIENKKGEVIEVGLTKAYQVKMMTWEPSHCPCCSRTTNPCTSPSHGVWITKSDGSYLPPKSAKSCTGLHKYEGGTHCQVLIRYTNKFIVGSKDSLLVYDCAATKAAKAPEPEEEEEEDDDMGFGLFDW